jgi:hypothetical protein
MRSLYYRLVREQSGADIAIYLEWDNHGLKIKSPKNPSSFSGSDIPENRKDGAWVSAEVNYEDMLALEELLLLTRLTLLPPESSCPDFPRRRLLIRSKQHALDMGWHGELPPLHWSPLQELATLLEELHRKYVAPSPEARTAN